MNLKKWSVLAIIVGPDTWLYITNAIYSEIWTLKVFSPSVQKKILWTLKYGRGFSQTAPLFWYVGTLLLAFHEVADISSFNFSCAFVEVGEQPVIVRVFWSVISIESS